MTEKSQTTTTKNHSDSLGHLHHSNHPGMISVSKQLTGKNYGTWSRAMSIALSAKNKIGFIDDSIPKPSQIDKPFEYLLWKRCNDMILSRILNSIDGELSSSVLYADSALEVWIDLNERCSQSNASRIYQSHRDIASHVKNHMTVASYYNKLKGFWDELASYNDVPTCTCGTMKLQNEREQREKVMQFLMGLNDSYFVVRGQILLMHPLPTIRKANSLIFQEEKQRELTVVQPSMESMVMLADNTHKNVTNSRTNHGKYHGNKREQLHCDHCNGNNHTIERCFFLHGFPSGHRWHKSTGKAANNSSTGNEKLSTVFNVQNSTPGFHN